MGRRGRAKARAAAAAESTPSTPITTGPTGWERRQQLLAWLNPAKRGSRGRARFAAIVFGVLALTLAGAALTNDRLALMRPAFLLAVLAVVWGLRAAFMRDEEPEP
ncbi:MAG TPA: hypothetical protein VNK73_11850 [Actinomycetota bacterium]|jgi:hypothetical protein|nr:hypothetical protein [Actinomycetota bacterium]